MTRGPRAAVAAVALCAAWSTVSGAQGRRGIPEDYRDSLVMRLVAIRAPCPDPVPVEWGQVDQTLVSAPKCSLVQAAALMLRARLATRPSPSHAGADPWKPLCVRVAEMDNTGSTGLPGDWMVVFDLTPTLSADVLIDRRSGAPVFAMLGDGIRRLGPPCVSR